MPFGRKKLHQNFDEQMLVALGSLAERLHNEVIAVAVDDQRRQQIAFAVDHAEGFRVFDNEFAIGNGLLKALGEKCAVDRHVLARQQPDRDLRFVAIESAPVEAPALVGQPHHGARLGLRGANVAAINPQVPEPESLDTSRADDHRSFCQVSCLREMNWLADSLQ